MKLKIKFNINYLFLIIVVMGFFLRLFFIYSRDLFLDEISYIDVAINNSFWGILNVTHWIKDHGILPFLILKFLTFFSSNIFFLRLFNLVPYLFISLFLYRFFIFFGFGYLGLLPVFLHSFLSYFVFMQGMVSPFNFVLLFSTVALTSLMTFVLSKKHGNLNLILFTLSSILAFYSDYSSAYFFLGIIPILFWVLIKERDKLPNLFCSLLIVGASIIPGLVYVANNFKTISLLNVTANINSKSLPLNFLEYLRSFSDILLLRTGGTASFIALLTALAAVLYIGIKSKETTLKFLSFFSLSTLAINSIFVYLYSKWFFVIFIERSFWFIYLVEVFIISAISFYLNNNKRYLILFLIVILFFIAFRLIDSRSSYYPGTVPDVNIKYKEFVNRIKEIPSFSQGQIVYYSQEFTYRIWVLREYYLKDRINKDLILYSNNYVLPENTDKSINPTILVVFDINSQEEIKNIKNKLQYLNTNKKIYTYKLECNNKRNCNFIQIY